MAKAEYAFISAYLKGEEARLLTSNHVDSIAQASSIEDALESIRETDVGSYLGDMDVKTFDDSDKYLWVYLGKCFDYLEWFKSVPSDIRKILKAYIVKYDILNIKAVLQALSTGKKARFIPIGLIHTCGLLEALSDAESVDDVMELLNQCKMGSYASILRGYNIDEGIRSRLQTEARLDGEYYRNLMDIAGRVKDGTTLVKTLGITIDMTNLQIILRAIIDNRSSEAADYALGRGYMISDAVVRDLASLKLSDIPGELKNTLYHDIVEEVVTSYDKTGTVSAIDEVIEKHKYGVNQEILSPRVLSPLMLAWYLTIKEIEIRNLRLILKAIFNNIPVEEVRKYLVLSS